MRKTWFKSSSSLVTAVTATGVCVALLSGATVATPGWADDPVAPQPSAEQQTRAEQPSKPDPKSSNLINQHAEDESPALGVIVGSCPGDGVCVMDTVWGSPAAEAGIRQGDYILAVDDTKISSPQELIQTLAKMKPGTQVSVTTWRQGQEQKTELMLASKQEQQPESHKAWLGVMLTPTDSKGVQIQRVMRDSPAAQAGLRSGDTIVKQNDQAIADIESFIASVEDLGPGSKLNLTILRNGQETQMPVQLGHVHDASIQFLRQAMRPNVDAPTMASPLRNGDEGTEMLDETLDEMRRQIRELQEQVKALSNAGDPPATAADENDLSQRPQPHESEILASDELTDSGVMLVAQRDRGRRGGNRNHDWDRGRHDRGHQDHSWQDRYRSGYRAPLYRSPRYGNQYYRYQGRPYYGNYGRGYGYGYGRSGIQLGNFGVYWY